MIAVVRVNISDNNEFHSSFNQMAAAIVMEIMSTRVIGISLS